MASMRERMLAGEPYRADDPELRDQTARAQAILRRLEQIPAEDHSARLAVLRELLGRVGDGVSVRPGFRCDYGTQISLGAGTFVNFDCVMLDVAPVEVGPGCQLAARVQLVTATHPVDPVARREGWEHGRPITLGENVWLGAGVIVLPGVTIGADTVVGAGAVVTRDLPRGVVADGVPARVRRPVEAGERA
jgi:maltose O-acetyltransferase